jgi:hypothetical protein
MKRQLRDFAIQNMFCNAKQKLLSQMGEVRAFGVEF